MNEVCCDMSVIWYEDDKYKVAFSEMPDVDNRIINKQTMDKETIKQIKTKPLIVKNDVNVLLVDKVKNKSYTFEIESGYCYDGASIPRFFWRFIGSKSDVRFQIGALIHDKLCEHHDYVDGDRYFADKVFERCLYVGDTCAFTRWLMFHSVDNFQKFCGWKKCENDRG